MSHSYDCRSQASIVMVRTSQLNHCAWRLDLHVEEARRAGVAQRKIDLIGEAGVPDDIWAAVRAQFDEQETVVLLLAIAAINVWNRMNVAVRTALPDQPLTAG